MTRQPGLAAYDDPGRFPDRVWRAVEESRRRDFALACIPEVGRLLQLCAGLHGVQRICELGTAYGVGAAWIESGMRPGATLLTVELDQDRAQAARILFADNSDVEVMTGDWSLALERGEFDLLFSDGGPKRAPGDPETIAPLVRNDGLVVLDDYTPGYEKNDVSRLIWLENPNFYAMELMLSPETSVILARKRAAAGPARRPGSPSGPVRG
jgi:predicted O-methyltransferase YrrM